MRISSPFLSMRRRERVRALPPPAAKPVTDNIWKFVTYAVGDSVDDRVTDRIRTGLGRRRVRSGWDTVFLKSPVRKETRLPPLIAGMLQQRQ